MKINSIAPDYKGFRFPPEIISHAVWLYFRFSLSFRDVEELLAQRGIVVTYETVRQWCLRGWRRPTRMNSVVVALAVATNGTWTRSSSRSVVRDITCGGPWTRMAMCSTSLCRADANREGRETLFRAALRVRLQYVPRVIITDKLKSYGAAKREILPGVEHRQHARAE
jgi:putative transposase